jgi:hypothetical protein
MKAKVVSKMTFEKVRNNTWSKTLDTVNSLETTNPRNLVPRVNHCWRLTLCSRENNIHEVRCRWHRGHLLKVVDRHGVCCDSPSPLLQWYEARWMSRCLLTTREAVRMIVPIEVLLIVCSSEALQNWFIGGGGEELVKTDDPPYLHILSILICNK